MPSVSNITKVAESTSIHTESTNSTIVKNTVLSQVDGENPSTQSYSISSMSVADYAGLSQAQQQCGYFVSLSDKTTIGSKISDYTSYQQDSLVQDVGTPYCYASDASAEQKDNRVTTDYKEKENTSIFSQTKDVLVSWGEDAVSTAINIINQESQNNSDENKKNNAKRIYPEWKLYGGTAMDGRGLENMDWCVTIMEDRESIEKIASEGSFGTDRVMVYVYQRVGNFSFGTSQNFDPVEPRGSQTPLRFYNHNPGRVLSFSAEFHQQEFPLEPLLSIAEKLQYLARPYRHGDYSLIPKLVRITIPGRTFRGYLTSVDITYQGEDYTSWNSDEIKKSLQASDWGTTYRRFSLADYKNGSDYVGNLNSNDGVTYGMERMTASLQLAIVEEIKLTQYTTFAEQKTEYIQNNQERASEMEAEVMEEWTKAVYEVGMYLQTEEGRALLDENGRPYSEQRPEDLIYVDIATGEVMKDSQGNIMTVYNSSPDMYMETMTEYYDKQALNNTNRQTYTPDIFEKQEDALGALYTTSEGGTTKPQLIQEILKLQEQGYLISDPPYTSESLESLPIEDLYNLKLQGTQYNNEDTKHIVSLVDFFTYYENNKGQETQNNYLSTESVLQNFRKLLGISVKTIDDCKKLAEFSGLTFTNEASLPDTKVGMAYFGTSAFSGSGVVFSMGGAYGLPENYAVSQHLENYGASYWYINLANNTFLDQKYKDWMTEYSISPVVRIPDAFKNIDDLKKKYTYIDNNTGKAETAILDCIRDTMAAMLKLIPHNFLTLVNTMKKTFPNSPVLPTKQASKGMSISSSDGFFYITKT